MKRLVARVGCLLIVWLSWLAGMTQNRDGPQPTLAALEQQLQKHLQEQKPELVIPLLREITSVDPKNANARQPWRPPVLQGNYGEAIPHLRTAWNSARPLENRSSVGHRGEADRGSETGAEPHGTPFPNLDDPKTPDSSRSGSDRLDSASARLDKAASVAVRPEELAPRNAQILLVAYQISRQMMSRGDAAHDDRRARICGNAHDDGGRA